MGELTPALRAALEAHDRALAARGVVVWAGAEPTYTDAASEDPQWLYSALGEDKRQRAARLAAHLAAGLPGAALLRSAGRPYAGEEHPRWSFGVYALRDGRAAWSGPPDPLCAGRVGEAASEAPAADPAAAPGVASAAAPGVAPAAAPGVASAAAPGVAPGVAPAVTSAAAWPVALAAAPAAAPAVAFASFAAAAAAALAASGWPAAVIEVADPLPLRLAFRFDGGAPPADVTVEPRLARPSLHRTEVDGAELRDALAQEGVGLILAGVVDDDLAGRAALRLELPALPHVAAVERLFAALTQALAACGAQTVILAGHPPPVDATVAWLTVTPDPAVVEVNMAPAAGALAFHRDLEAVDAAARALGLSGHRLHYNGVESDSGGGGQITLGGPAPRSSPFLLHPALLPGLVRYFHRHPSLSYWWGPDAAGASSQGPRADEGLRDSLGELDLALEFLSRRPPVDPDVLQAALAPFLVDASGNAHRAEINVEKLWSDRLGSRGRLGLVEFRSQRMAAEPAPLSARVALLRALAAMVAAAPPQGPLEDWGRALHDRFSLPFYLRADLCEVLRDLAHAGLGLGPTLEALLLDDAPRRIASVVVPGATLHLGRAVEFWPLLGDVASQEQGGSRLVDPSTVRVEIRLQDRDPLASPADWQVAAGGIEVPVREERDDRGRSLVAGIRYRGFVPAMGLHPALPAQAPLVLRLAHPLHGAHQITLHDWQPTGGAYDGLPRDRGEAAARRAARCVLAPAPPAPPPRPPPARACGEHVLDLRWARALGGA